MVRVLLGLLKGGLIGGAAGYAAWKAGLALGPGAGVIGYLVYGVVGFVSGIVCGRAIWRQETLVTPILKGLAGFLVGMGLHWVARKALGSGMAATMTAGAVPVGALLAVP